MTDAKIILAFDEQGKAINNLMDIVQAHNQVIIATDARVHVHEDMMLDRGMFLWLAVRNLFDPDGVRAEIQERYIEYSKGKPRTALPDAAKTGPKGPEIEVVTLKPGETVQDAMKAP